MPTISFEPEVLDTEDDLWDLFKVLKGRGWVGSIGAGAENPGEGAAVITKVDMHAAPDASSDGVLGPDGIRRLTAALGDVKVTIGNAITAMTQDAYTAAYGGTA